MGPTESVRAFAAMSIEGEKAQTCSPQPGARLVVIRIDPVLLDEIGKSSMQDHAQGLRLFGVFGSLVELPLLRFA